ncbi:MAG TPA: hypothetical protein DCZ80_07690 [Legionellales bacterium]|nr:hypothetical protein [Legionellales bacterium]
MAGGRQMNDSKSLRFSIIVFLALLVVIGLSPWTPRYPISAKLIYQPKLFVMRASLSGVLKNPSIRAGSQVTQGDELFSFIPTKSLMNEKYEQLKLDQLEKKLQFYDKELSWQKAYLSRLHHLYQKKLIAAEEYQQKKSRYFQYGFEKYAVIEKINALKHQQMHRLQAPIAGTILKVFAQHGELIYKNQKLVIIEPQDVKRKFLIQVPIDLKDKVFIGQTLQLAWNNQARVQNYPIVATVQEISPVLKKNSLVLLAKIQTFHAKKQNLYSKLPLNGYLIGPRQAFWKFLKNSLMGEE